MKKEEKSSETLLDERLAACPNSPGVYLMKDQAEHVIYVGKAKNLKSRVSSYFQNSADHSAKTLHLVLQIRDIEYFRTSTDVEALLLENTLIKKWKPKYNIRLKDDKTYPYLKMDTTHPFPRVYVVRKQMKGDGALYYGPYPSGLAVREVAQLSAKVFQLRDCRDHDFANRSRPCLSYEIGHCSAPCVGKVSSEQYAEQVREYKDFLEAKTGDLEDKLELQMEEYSNNLEFEKAAQVRDRIKAIQEITGQVQRMIDTKDLRDRDLWVSWPEKEALQVDTLYMDLLILQFRAGKWVGRHAYELPLGDFQWEDEGLFANFLLQHYSKHEVPEEICTPTHWQVPLDEDFAVALSKETHLKHYERDSRGVELYKLALENVKGIAEEKQNFRDRSREALESIVKLMDLKQLPLRMECIDISNFQGEANVASAVVFLKGQPAKSEYRHYKIQGFDGQNDFASMKEVMSRRYAKPDSPRPDLLVIDGGKAQLAAVMEMMEGLQLSFPVVGLAKARTLTNFQGSEVESSEERLFFPNQKNAVPIKNKSALHLLSHLRDEAHRFAITFHRQQRDKARFGKE